MNGSRLSTPARKLNGRYNLELSRSDPNRTKPRAAKQNPLFFGERVPTVEIRKEKAWHRLAIDMFINGVETRTIANTLGREQKYVAAVLNQDWARKYMAEETKKRSACDEIRQILEAEGPQALKRITYLAETKPGTPLGFEADKEILNRLLGRPTQPITHDQPPVKDLDFDELRQQVNRIVTGVPGTNGNSDGPSSLG